MQQSQNKRRLCWVRPGQKIQCIDADFGLVFGQVYTVTNIGWSAGNYHHRLVEDWGVGLAEIENPGRKDGLLCIRRFRPLFSSHKTDISIFRAMLDAPLTAGGDF